MNDERAKFQEHALKRIEKAVEALEPHTLEHGEFFLVIVGKASMSGESHLDLMRGCVTNLPKNCIPDAVKGLEHGTTARAYEGSRETGKLRTLEPEELEKLRREDMIERMLRDLESSGGTLKKEDLN